MQRINVLSIQHISAEDRAKIEAVDPAIELTDAGGWYDGEIRETWPAFTTTRYLAPGAAGSGTREERDRLLAEAEVILGGWPFPLDLRARAPRLKWFHQRPAGASNLLAGDLWGSRVVVTTSRGSGNTLAMAEYAVAGILHSFWQRGCRSHWFISAGKHGSEDASRSGTKAVPPTFNYAGIGFLAACRVFGEAARQMSCVGTCRRRRNEFAEARPWSDGGARHHPKRQAKSRAATARAKAVNQQA